MFTAGVDRRDALRPDGKLRLVGIVQKDLHSVLALRDRRRRWPEFWNLVARQILSHAVGAPDRVDFSGENLTGIEVKRDLDGLTRQHVFQVFLEEGRQQITIRFRDQSRDPANAPGAGYHAGANLKVDDAAILRGSERRVVQLVQR